MQQHFDTVRDLEARLKSIESILGRIQTGGRVRMTRLVGVLPPSQGGSGIVGSQNGAGVWVAVGDQAQGNVVKWTGGRDAGNTNAPNDIDVIGVVDGSATGPSTSVLDTENMRVRHLGYQAIVNVDGAVTVGDYLASADTLPGFAVSVGVAPVVGAFAIALDNAAGPGAGQVPAFLFPTLRQLPTDTAEELWFNDTGSTIVLGSVVELLDGPRANPTGSVESVAHGVVIADAPDQTDARVKVFGYQPVVLVTGVVAQGDYLRTTSTSGQAESAGNQWGSNVFGMALTGNSGGVDPSVEAVLFIPGITTALNLHQPLSGNHILRLQTEPSAIVGRPTVLFHQADGLTVDATPADIFYVQLPASSSMLLTAKVVARRTGGTAGSAEDGAGYVVAATFKNVAGVSTLIGAVAAIATMEDQAGWACTFAPDGTDGIFLRVTGAVDNDIVWSAVIEVQAVSS